MWTWRCDNCGATVNTPIGVTPDTDGCWSSSNGKHHWYRID